MSASSAPSTVPSSVSLSSATGAPLPQRLVSLDAYRGLTMFAMSSDAIGLGEVARQFKDSPFWQALAYQVDHVPWVGCAVWDMIQPSFMFIVGVAMIFSCSSRADHGQTWGRMAWHAAWRSVVLILLGVFLRSENRPQTNFMFEDVLTQIGLGYFFLFLLWDKSPAVQLAAAVAILLGDWALFYFYPLPPQNFDYSMVNLPADWPHLSGISAHWDKNTNAAAAFDRWFMNLFPRDPRETPFVASPGGYQMLNFIPALATMIFGLLAGGLLKSDEPPRRKISWLIVSGIIGIALGWSLDHWGLCPLVKRIWTPSWTLFSAGIVAIALAVLYAVVDVLRFRRWTFPFVVVGMNSILMYVMAEIMRPWIFRRWHTHFDFGSNVFTLWNHVPPAYEPLVRGSLTLLVMWLICYWCYRQRIFIRI